MPGCVINAISDTTVLHTVENQTLDFAQFSYMISTIVTFTNKVLVCTNEIAVHVG